MHDLRELEGLEIGDSTSPLGSGGMRSKVLAAEIAGAAGIPAVICNGVRAGALEAALAGEPEGTRFHPGPARHNSFKLWLRYAKPAHGTLVIDAGATRALREQGTSLLPVGVVEVRGEFDAGDAVEIAEPGGAVIAKGLCNYSALELRRAQGPAVRGRARDPAARHR